MSDLRIKTINGLKWGAIERFSNQGISFVISIIIARILLPADYGLIGLTAVFIGIPQVFISSGFGAALVRKQDRTEVDMATVFYYNISVSSLLYLLLFIAAPFIADYFEENVLTHIIRILGLNFVINSFQIIQGVQCTIDLNFKVQTKISVIATIGSGVLGLVMAYMGMGVWALVAQHVSYALFSTLLYCFLIKWHPASSFSMQSFRELFGYGSKLLASALLDTVFNNIYSLVIGKKYSVGDLGFYARANSLAELPASNLTGILRKVTFPVLSKLQDDEEAMVFYHRKMIRITCLAMFPIMGFIILYAHPLIEVLLSEKWLPAAPLLQIVCVGAMFSPLQVLNANPLYVKARTDLVLILEIMKKIVVITALIITVSYGVTAICIGFAVASIISFFLNIYYVKKVFPLSFVAQIKDVASTLLVVLFVCGVSALIFLLSDNAYIILFAGGSFSILFYLFVSSIFQKGELQTVLRALKTR